MCALNTNRNARESDRDSMAARLGELARTVASKGAGVKEKKKKEKRRRRGRNTSERDVDACGQLRETSSIRMSLWRVCCNDPFAQFFSESCIFEKEKKKRENLPRRKVKRG